MKKEKIKEEVKKPLPRNKVIRFFVVIVFLPSLIYAFMRFNQSPANGVINNDAVFHDSQPKQNQSNHHYSSETIGFDYPANYTDLQQNKPNGIITEQMSTVVHDNADGTRRISVTVKKSGAGVVMGEDAAYKLRYQDTASYTYQKETIGNKTYDTFTQKNGTEITYFIQGQSFYAIISGTTTINKEKLLDDMQTVAASFNWQA